ncbi:MAG: PaaI family thioesterase [Puniceicoccaceae bacterium]
MIHKDKLPPALIEFLEQRPDIDLDRFEVPPPVFMTMEGKITDFDPGAKCISCSFPVRPDQLNPFGMMQGGIISAAIDNTIGPLSMLVAPPSITRKLEVKYYKAVEPAAGKIFITAKLIGQKKRFLFFEAVAENEDKSVIFASAEAMHWML